jgi:SAM-dependent methyltransferase
VDCEVIRGVALDLAEIRKHTPLTDIHPALERRMADDLAPYFAGKQLYGDDFSIEQIREWFADEAEGYADLGAREKPEYSYGYHRLNQFHAFNLLRGRQFDHALGIGSAYGDEFRPIATQIRRITILDPSEAFAGVTEIFGTPCTHQKPEVSGDIAFGSGSFDLIVSLGALHHIPNVSHVISECYRCLRPKGLMILREPILSMGDWRKPRIGLTRRERGIPAEILDGIVRRAGFTVRRRSLCDFPPIPRVAGKFGLAAYNNYVLTLMDALVSRAFSWNIKYHRTRLHEKLAPSSAFYVLEK